MQSDADDFIKMMEEERRNYPVKMNKGLAIECIETQRQFADELTREAFDMAVKALKEPERKKGRWERHYCEDGNPDGWACSKCGEWFYFGDKKPNFCPDCGADMRGDEDAVD